MAKDTAAESEVQTIDVSDEQIEALMWPRRLTAIPEDVLSRIS
ncbi:hypothetical protein ACQP1K_28860 (plasmid) [Sphaerimonospora sp. CA-214678]